MNNYNKMLRPLHDDSVFSTFLLFMRMLSLLSSELASFPESTEACLRIFRGLPSLEDSFSSLSFSDDNEEAATAIFSLASGCLDEVRQVSHNIPSTKECHSLVLTSLLEV